MAKFAQKEFFESMFYIRFGFLNKATELTVVFFPGKTLLAKAVANQTSATFLRVVGSELIQKYLVRFHFIFI